MKRCDSCAAGGIHLACAGLNSEKDYWECAECSQLTGQMAALEEEEEEEEEEHSSDTDSQPGPSRKRMRFNGKSNAEKNASLLKVIFNHSSRKSWHCNIFFFILETSFHILPV